MSKNQANNKEKRGGFIDYLTLKTSLPSDGLAGEFRLELRGRGQLMIYGCRRILEYFPERISVAIKGFAVAIVGGGLICTTFHQGTVCIEGEICKIELCDGQGDIR